MPGYRAYPMSWPVFMFAVTAETISELVSIRQA